MDEYKVRPSIATIQSNLDSSDQETFQNTIIRPIIKMKHELLMAYFRTYLIAKKNPLNGLSAEKRIVYLESAFQRDMNLRSELRGIVLGHLTTKEYDQYADIKNEVNKRINNIIKTRMIDHLDLLATDPP